MKRINPSKTSEILVNMNILKGNILDFGCGYGFDADHYGWKKYDPYYHDVKITEKYDTIVCMNVLNVVSSKIRKEVTDNVQELLNDDGIGYLCVPRNIPTNGKFSGYHRRPQNYVVLSLESIYNDKNIEIYKLTKNDKIKDTTINIGE